MDRYENPLGITSQFPHCGNPFRADTYRSCSFGCKYCFSNARGGNIQWKQQIADISMIRKWFSGAIDNGETNNIKKEMLNHRVPIHLGGMSDPFQSMEFDYGATYDFLQLTKEYDYPVNISTKTAFLPEKYWSVLDPRIHTFSLSILGWNDDYVRIWEANTPTAKERAAFAKELHDRGFWVSIRIQPLIDIEEAKLLIRNTEKFVNFYTVEHLKLASDNDKNFQLMVKCLRQCNLNITNLVSKGREYEFTSYIKLDNINTLKEYTEVPIGCGDNDFHILSEAHNCCGIDLMPSAFQNWMKYNSMRIKQTGERDVWSPSKNCTGCFNSTCIKKGLTRVKEYVDLYYSEHYGDDDQLRLF